MDVGIYQDRNGNEPFSRWLFSFRDRVTLARIRKRLRRVEETGNLGDYRSVGDGVFELRLQFGSGYRIYFGMIGDNAIVLLRGGDKTSQIQDIDKAKRDWKVHREREFEHEQL